MDLPNSSQFTYVIKSFKQMPCEKFSGAPKYAFELQGCINISTADQANEWLSQMLLHSKCTYRHTRGKKSKCKKVLYKACMHCQHQKGINSKTRTKTKETSKEISIFRKSKKKENWLPQYVDINCDDS